MNGKRKKATAKNATKGTPKTKAVRKNSTAQGKNNEFQEQDTPKIQQQHKRQTKQQKTQHQRTNNTHQLQ